MDQAQMQQPLTKKQRRELRRQEKADSQQQSMNTKKISRIVIWTVVVLAIAGGVYGLVVLAGKNPTTVPTLSAVTDSDWVRGNRSASVVLVEYSDFQCPACGAFYPVIKELEGVYTDRVAFVFRDFPLRSLHPNAQAAAQAAEAAGLQGKFWEMHDKLFETQDSWSGSSTVNDIFDGYAQELGLNVEQFKTDRAGTVVKDKIDRDYSSGTAARVQGTPSFFLNGEKISNPTSVDDFKKLIDTKLGTAQ